VLREHGLDIPEDYDVKVVADASTRLHLKLSPKQGAEGELTDRQLSRVAGGFLKITFGDILVSSYHSE
jgi:hypothetical protein